MTAGTVYFLIMFFAGYKVGGATVAGPFTSMPACHKALDQVKAQMSWGDRGTFVCVSSTGE